MPLRVGVLTLGDSVPDWLVRALEEATAAGIVELVLVATGSIGGTSARSGPRPALALRVLRWLDDRFLRLSRSVDHPLGDWAGTVARVPVTLGTDDQSYRLAPSDSDQLRRQRLDVLIQAWPGRPVGLTEVATYGTWRFQYGDDRISREGPPALWEVLEDRTTTGITLWHDDAKRPGGVPVARTVAKTRRFSIARNSESMYPRSIRLLVRSLQRAHDRGDPRQSGIAEDPTRDPDAGPSYGEPTNRDVLRLVPRLAARFVVRRLRWPRRGTLAWHYRPGVAGSAPHRSLSDYREIPAPRGHFWADPFVVWNEGRWWVFFEDFSFATTTGVIRVCEIGPGGMVGEPQLALEASQHLSYPYVFRHDGDWFMLPETRAAGQVALYRATRFPFEWAPDRVLMDGVSAVDATLHQADGRWYLFTSLAEPGIETTEELHLFVADSPFGPFTVHPASPIVTDVRRARMAGRLFTEAGLLYRPAQSAVPYYGSSVVVNRVARLTPEEYSERPAYVLLPNFKRGVLGIHTLNAADGLSLIDLFRPG